MQMLWVNLKLSRQWLAAATWFVDTKLCYAMVYALESELRFGELLGLKR